MGNMDGVFVVYHNTIRAFGFQYVALCEMDQHLFGNSEGCGDRVFEKCVALLETILTEVTDQFPGQSVRLLVEKLSKQQSLKVFVEPADWSVAEKGPAPVVMLNVDVQHFIDGKEVRGCQAMDELRPCP